MALFKPYKITSDKLADLPVREGQIVVTTDTKKLYVDVSATERIEVTSDAEVDLSDYVTSTMLSSAIGAEASERQEQDNLLDDKIDTKLDTTQADGRYALKDNPKLTGNVDISNEDWQGGKITAAHSNGETEDYYKYVIGFDSLHRPYIAKKEGENTVSTIYLASDSIVFSKPLSFTDSSGVSTNPEAANQTRQNIGAAAIDHTHDVATADTDGFMSAEDKAKLDGLEEIDTSVFVTKEDADAAYAAIEHNHNDRYYTESEVDSKLADKANATHTHAIGDVSNLQETIEGLEQDIAGKANAEHTHDDRYFTETEVTKKLATKADTGHKHAASDVTSGTFELDRIPTITDAKIAGMSASKLTGTIPTANLPSYVDDVVEGATTSDFPETGEAGKIYVATSTNKTYRWSGSGYVEISASLALGTTSSTAFRGDYGNIAYTHATAKGAAFGSGLYKITTNAQGHVTAATAVTKADITALGIPGSDTNTNTTYTLTKSGSTITLSGSDGSSTSVTDANTTYSLGSFGITATAAELNKLDGVTATATELNYVDGVTSNIQTQLNGKASSGHTHDVATADTDGFMSAEDKAKLDGLEEIDTSVFVTKEDADAAYAAIEHNHNDRYYTESEVDSKLADKANATHTHAIGDVSNLQETIEGLEQDIAGKANAEHTHDDRYFTETEVTKKLATKADTGHKHAASDVTSGTFELDRIPTITDAKIAGMSASKLTGTIPTANLPSYVDDVVEGATTSDFPETGEAGKIYVATSTNKTYRWSGSGYVEISASLALGTTSSTAFRGDYGNIAYTHATAKGAAFGSGLYKITTNAQGHVTAATAVTKADITALGIPGSDTNTNTTYTLTKSGSTITLSGSDGSSTSVTDANTTYSLGSFGITATAAELNKLDGVTATATELNYVDGVTSNIQTQLNGKASSGHTHDVATADTDGFMSAEDKAKLDGLEEIDTSVFVTKEDADAAYAAIEHNHNDRYYTESEVDSKLADKANATHTHAIGDVSNLQETIEGLEQDIAGKANAEHTHDDRYFTETEVTKKLATKADTGHKHAASDVTSGTFELDRIPTITDAKIAGMSASKLTGTIPTANLPSYVDDVVEGATTSDFPETGEAGKIYVATSTNKTYRWSGSGYVEISASLALGTTSSTAFRGDYGNIAYTHATAKGAAFGSGLYKITTNAQGHVTAATAVTKADITALGIPGSDTNTNTTYTLTKSGSTITLSGSDGSSTSVTDANTTYSLGSFGITATAAELNKLDGVTATATELNYVDGVTSNIQTQLNGKASSGHTHANATTTAAGFLPKLGGGTTNFLRADGSWAKPPDTNTTYTLSSFGITATAAELNKLDGCTATVTELNYLDGVKSNIQTQLNGKAASSHSHSYLPLAGGTMNGPIHFNASSLAGTGTGKYVCCIDDFADGGEMKYISAASLRSAIGAAASSHTHSYLPLAGGTMTGNITLRSLGGNWVQGKTSAPIMCNGASSVDGSSYHPIIMGKTTAGDVWNFGHGASDQVGFFGFYEERTADGTDWSHYIKVSDGTVHFGKTVYCTTFSGSLSGNASTATTATQANYWTTARTLTFTGNVTGSVSVRGNANMSCALTLANDSVTSAKIAANAVTSSEIASGAVGLAELSSAVGTVAVQSATPTDSHVKLWIKV